MSANNLMAAAAPNTYEDVNDELTIQVKEYSDELVNNLRNLDHRQFFQEVRLRCFPNVKLGFMEYFITLTMMIRKFIVPGDKLREYGIVTTNKSSDIARCLEQYGLVEDEDYVLRNVAQNPQGGRPRKEYTLSKKAFKLSLMRAKNSYEYANYYYLLEQVTGLYYEYLDKYNAKLLTIKDDKIDRQTTEIQELKGTVNEQTAKIDELLARTNHIVVQNDNLDIGNRHLNNKIDELKGDVEEVKEAFRGTLEDRNPKPEEAPLQHYFVLLRSKDEPNVFKYIRAQLKYVNRELGAYEATHDVIIQKRYNANPVDMYNRFKKTVKDDIKALKEDIKQRRVPKQEKVNLIEDLNENPPIKCRYSDITICLDKITEEELVAKIDECDLERNNVPVQL